MRRIFPLILVVALLLCACGDTPEPTTAPSSVPTVATTAPTTQATTVATTAPTTQATTIATTAPTEPEIIEYRHPLNGTLLDAPYTGTVTAVLINNISSALPQHGIGDADVLYEVETEGGITRMLAVFSDIASVDKIGPVRSIRSYFNSIAASYDAPVLHCGGSYPGLAGHYDDSHVAINGWMHVDEMYNSSYFFRDQDRLNSGYSKEHTLFTNGEKATQVLEKKGYLNPADNVIDYGLKFHETDTPDGQAATKVVVKFWGGKTTTMEYDSATGLYGASQHNRKHIDANTGDQMTFRNVIVLQTKQWFVNDGTYDRSFYTLFGSGTGHLAVDGQIVPIMWSRDGINDPFVFTLEDGTPVTLGTGSTYIGIVSSKRTVEFS